jgi:hypothetical protein
MLAEHKPVKIRALPYEGSASGSIAVVWFGPNSTGAQ